ncbi:unnamed protein product [Schistosoma turkestanicum]|nr:unnamed protein product [Schistosoma turkestanicum]
MDDPSRVSTQSSTEEYRTPIPQRNEQLLPVVVPLLPVHLQNSPILQTRRRAFVAEDSDDNSDDDTVTSGARCRSLEKSKLISKSDHSMKQRCSYEHDESNSSSIITDNVSSGSSGHLNGHKDGVIKRKRKHLQQLYQPPVEILFNGTIHAAKFAAQEKHAWLLVSIHDEGCFDCHLLNRDVWKDSKIYQLIKRHCIFVQIPADSSEGLRFRSTYSYVQSASHIAILDPFTGEQKMMWTHLNDPKIVYDVLSQFIQHTTLTNPNNSTTTTTTTNGGINFTTDNGQGSVGSGSSTDSVNAAGDHRTDSTSIGNHSILRRRKQPADEIHQQFDRFMMKRPRLQTSDNDVEYIDLSNSVHSSQTTCTTTTTTTTTTNPLDLTEEEQLQLAIEASKKEIKRKPFTHDDNEIILTDDDDDGDEDGDDHDEDEYLNGVRYSATDLDRQQQRDQERAKRTKYTNEDDNDDDDDDDCVVVNCSDKKQPSNSSSSAFVSSTTALITSRRPLRPTDQLNDDLKSDALTELPSPAVGEPVMELLFRLPDGKREVYRLQPTLTLRDLHSFFEYRGYPANQYEILRIHPSLRLSSMPPLISLTTAGVCTKDTLFIQER